MHIVRKLGSRRFKLVPDDVPKVDAAPEEPKATETVKVPKAKHRILSTLGTVTGISAHTSLFKKFFGPAVNSLKSASLGLLGEVVSGADVLGKKYFPRASGYRLGSINAGAALVLLLGFSPFLFFATRSLMRLSHFVENQKVRAAHDLAEKRKASEAAMPSGPAHAAEAVSPSNPTPSQEKKP